MQNGHQMTHAAAVRRAPKGFSHDQWRTFEEQGFLILEDAIDPEDIQRYIEATDEVAGDHFDRHPGKAFSPWSGVAHLHPAFTELIDHPRHVGFAYDVYGEQLKLHNSQAFIRPPGGSDTAWHLDGPRVVPYRVYSPRLPLQLKVAYWLTDLPRTRMGNLVVYPGSHRSDTFEAYTRTVSVPGELPICVRAGTMMIMSGNIFHTVMPNDSNASRYNLFYTYCPSWVCEADRLAADPDWTATLSREQRIIMRSYEHPYDRTKPRDSEFPLYLDRHTGLDHDHDADLAVPLAIRRRRTTVERWLGHQVPQGALAPPARGGRA